jgi:hypothetical protein
MPLAEIWKATPQTILGMNISAILNIATNGDRLRDGSAGAQEFREFIGEIDSTKLAEYANYCVVNAFQDSGQVLQDLVNEIGRRIGFKAENGRYQGVRNDIGYDGIWTDGAGSIVVEVKTTDAYTIKLDTVARYRDRLVEEGRVEKDSPILLVIGRNDTSSLEAQVRGSKHAWSMRIVGIDALIKLMDVNLSTSSSAVTEKIHTILRPMEYTRIDEIVDIVFTTVEDKESSVREELGGDDIPDQADEQPSIEQDRTPKEVIAECKKMAVELLAQKEQLPIIRKRHSMYSSSNDEVRAVIAVSKRYERDGGYWYAFHDSPQRVYLRDAKKSYFVLGMVDKNFVHAIPLETLDLIWDDLGETVRANGSVYKHIVVSNDGGLFSLRLKGANRSISIDEYRLGK